LRVKSHGVWFSYRAAARRLLAPVHAEFADSHDTADLRDAKAALKQGRSQATEGQVGALSGP